MHGDPVLGIARDLALSGLDILPALKREFVRHTAGLAALGDGVGASVAKGGINNTGEQRSG